MTSMEFMAELHARLLPGSRSLFLGYTIEGYKEEVRIDRRPGKDSVYLDVGECSGKTWDVDQVAAYVRTL